MEVVVYTDTNINTRFAISVCPDISTSDFKRELERTHLSLFPTLGHIKALQLMVRRKRCFYHLTDSLPLKYAFQRSNKTWFLHVAVHTSSNCLNKPITLETRETESVSSKCDFGLQGNNVFTRSCDSHSSIASGNHREMANNNSKGQINYSFTIPPRRIFCQNSLKKAVGVGRRIVVATNNLRVSPKPVISLYRQRLSCGLPKLQVFEFSDSDN